MLKRCDTCQALETRFQSCYRARWRTHHEGLKVSSIGIWIIKYEEIRFFKLVRLSPEGLSISSSKIISNKSCVRGAFHVKPQRLNFVFQEGSMEAPLKGQMHRLRFSMSYQLGYTLQYLRNLDSSN